MTSDLLEENQDLRKQVEELQNAYNETEELLTKQIEATYKLDKENAELKEKNEGYCRSRDRLISIGFPTFKDCKEYAEHLTKAKEMLKWALHSDPEHDEDFEKKREEAEQFLQER